MYLKRTHEKCPFRMVTHRFLSSYRKYFSFIDFDFIPSIVWAPIDRTTFTMQPTAILFDQMEIFIR